MSAPALEARGLVRRFGGLLATDNVSFQVQPGARQALIGRERIHDFAVRAASSLVPKHVREDAA